MKLKPLIVFSILFSLALGLIIIPLTSATQYDLVFPVTPDYSASLPPGTVIIQTLQDFNVAYNLNEGFNIQDIANNILNTFQVTSGSLSGIGNLNATTSGGLFVLTPTTSGQITITSTATTIFNNNILVAGISLIPVVGWGYLIFVLWNTGVVIASYGQPWYWIFNNPFAWIELAVYSYMVLQSWKLFTLLKQNKLRDWIHPGGYFKVTVIKTIAYAIITAILILLVSAIIEYAVISLKVLI